jgi:hypothetical protein
VPCHSVLCPTIESIELRSPRQQRHRNLRRTERRSSQRHCHYAKRVEKNREERRGEEKTVDESSVFRCPC